MIRSLVSQKSTTTITSLTGFVLKNRRNFILFF